MGFKNRHHYLKYDVSRKDDDDYKQNKRRLRKEAHQRRRQREIEESKAYYQENKEYFRAKNRDSYKKNGDKWAKRRREIVDDWKFNKCSPTFVENTFITLGASITTDGEITFSQLCGLIVGLGYKIEEVTYPPFIHRQKYFNKKRTP